MINWEQLEGYAVPAIKMILILLVGHIIIINIKRIAKKAFAKANFDISLSAFLVKTIGIVLYVLIIMSALNCIGISTTGILAALSAAAVAIAVALKDSLSNVAGGILLLIAPRFSTGDFIEAGSDSGTVLSVDLLHTTIRTVDNKQVSIPNGVLINTHITNYSKEPLRRVDIEFSISYESDVEKAKKIIYDVIVSHPATLKEPEAPLVRVNKYSDSAVDIITRSWCNNADYWNLYFDLTEKVRQELESNSITIPYNQLDVHIKNS